MPIILTVRHFTALWGVDQFGRPPALATRTLEMLKESQRAFVAQNPATHAPEEINDPVLAYVGNGAWRIKCRCAEATHTDPDFKQACCFGCGAIYTNVLFPDDRADIEELLSERRVQHYRSWESGETVLSLSLEQLAHNDPVPAKFMPAAIAALAEQAEEKRVKEEQALATEQIAEAAAEAEVAP